MTVRDEFVNVKDVPVGLEVLYHWNFGPPHLDEGARFVAPLDEVIPRDARAVEDLATYDVYGPPEPGYAEQVYFCSLRAEAGRTAAMARGVRFGRRPTLTPEKLAHARRLIDEGHMASEAAELLGVHRATLWRALRKKGSAK